MRPGAFREAPLAVAAAPLLRWLATAPAAPNRAAVFSSWSLGYLIRYYAGRPVVASPFGTDGGAGAMEDTAAFFNAASEQAAEAVLTSRQAGFVLLPNPLPDVQLAQSLLPAGTERPVVERFNWREGGAFTVTSTFARLPAARLYFYDRVGQPPAGVPGLGGFRLVSETPSSRPPTAIMEARLKLFAVVPGARVTVEGARPGSRIVGTVPVLSNQGRRFLWSTVAAADEAGRAVLRVPYATGRNGLVDAGPCTLDDGASRGRVGIAEEDVTAGRAVRASLVPRTGS